VRFWDSSAIVPLLAESAPSRHCRELLRADPVQVVWLLTATEVVSALCRLKREAWLDAETLGAAEKRLDRFGKRWTIVQDVDGAMERAERLLHEHVLTAADALQLAAALTWARDRPKGRAFVAQDDALVVAARGEGFDVVVPGQ
jgi:predicted nucleic acid-binding protein